MHNLQSATSMFFVKRSESDVPWHGLGNPLTGAPDIATALKMSECDFHVDKEPCFDQRGRIVRDTWLNVRDTDKRVLGVVGNAYCIVQPQEAYDFLDAIVGHDLVLETGGLLASGRMWILAKTPPRTVLGDQIANYLAFSTTFDGTSSFRVDETPTRVVCQNTLTLSAMTAKRSWKARHSGNMKDKLSVARETLKLSDAYLDAFQKKAEAYAKTKVSAIDFNKIVDEVFGAASADDSKKVLSNREHLKSQLGVALRADDLESFKGSAWHLYNAFGDFATHIDPVRKTANWRENLWESFIDGNKTLLTVEAMLDQLVAA